MSNPPPQCPLCESGRILRDDPPVRGYFFLFLGLILILMGRFLHPDLFSPSLAAEQSRLLLLGIVLVVYGIYLNLRHGNRWCGSCGFRFRLPIARQGEGVAIPRLPWEKAQTFSFRDRIQEDLRKGQNRGSEGDRHETVPPDQPIPPLLACLSFRDPRQRENAARTLRILTGQSFDADAEAWKKWYAEHGAAFEEERKKRRAAGKA